MSKVTTAADLELVIRSVVELGRRRLNPHSGHQWPDIHARPELEAAWIREASRLVIERGANHGKLEEWIAWVHGGRKGPDPTLPTTKPVPDGPPKRWQVGMVGANLYSHGAKNDRLFLPWSRVVTAPEQSVKAYLKWSKEQGHTHIVVSCSTSRRPEANEVPYDPVGGDPARLLDRVDLVLSYGLAVIANTGTLEFYRDVHRNNFDRMVAHSEEVVRLLGRRVDVVMPTREIGKLNWGLSKARRLARYNHWFKSLRAACRAVWGRETGDAVLLGAHERVGEGIDKRVFQGVTGDTASFLQLGFGTPLRGSWKPVPGGHTYDGAIGFLQDMQRRWRGHSRHIVGAFEHSIPVDGGGRWKPTRTLRQAGSYGTMLLQAGAAFDLSGGARR